MKMHFTIMLAAVLTGFAGSAYASQIDSDEMTGKVEVATSNHEPNFVPLVLREVDGKRLTSTRQSLRLAPGKHVLKLTTHNQGLGQTVAIELTIEPGRRYVLSGVPESNGHKDIIKASGISGISVSESALEN